eukprot:6509220-Pyramimonas_sp.AAC.1
MATGRPPKDLFHPLCKMQFKKYKFRSCSVHIVSDSTVSFKTAAGKNVAPSLHVMHFMRELVHGMSANVAGDCKGPVFQEAARSHKWSGPGHQHYEKGVHAPVRFVFWFLIDISDQSTCNLLGVRVEGKRGEDPRLLAGALRVILETSDRIIDDAVKRSPD